MGNSMVHASDRLLKGLPHQSAVLVLSVRGKCSSNTPHYLTTTSTMALEVNHTDTTTTFSSMTTTRARATRQCSSMLRIYDSYNTAHPA
jgi:hypothetical protein